MPLLTKTGFVEFEPHRARFVSEKDLEGFPYAELDGHCGFWIKPSKMESLTQSQLTLMKESLKPGTVKWLEGPLSSEERKKAEQLKARMKEMFGDLFS